MHIVHHSDKLICAVHGSLFVHVYRGVMQIPDLDDLLEAERAHIQRVSGPISSVGVVTTFQTTTVSGEDVRVRATEILKELFPHVRAMALAIDAEGFLASIARSFVAGVFAVGANNHEYKVGFGLLYYCDFDHTGIVRHCGAQDISNFSRCMFGIHESDDQRIEAHEHGGCNNDCEDYILIQAYPLSANR